MTTRASSPSPNLFFNWPAYLTLAAIGAAGILSLESFLGRWGALVLLILFGFLIDRYPPVGTAVFHRRANLYLALQTALVVTLLLISGANAHVFTLLFFILSAIAALVNTFRLGLAWISLFGFITAASFVARVGWGTGLGSTLPLIGGYFFFLVVANALHRASAAQTESTRLLADLRRANEQLTAYARQVEALAISEERNRMAREMHDTVGHRLTVAAVQLEAAQRLISSDPERAASMVETGRDQVRAGLQDLRRTVAQLRQPLETGLSLPTAIQRLAEAFQAATGVQVHLDLQPGECELPALHHQALYRAVQEGLTNIQRHAQARQAWIELSCHSGSLHLRLRDDGPGEDRLDDAEPPGFGLLGLQERAAQLNGEVEFTRLPEGGALLQMRLPQPAEMTHA
jgi:signal transduction histidine kinase